MNCALYIQSISDFVLMTCMRNSEPNRLVHNLPFLMSCIRVNILFTKLQGRSKTIKLQVLLSNMYRYMHLYMHFYVMQAHNAIERIPSPWTWYVSLQAYKFRPLCPAN